MLRGGAFTDDVVINLIRRRFTAFYYDVAEPGKQSGDAWAYDAEAVKAIGKFAGGKNGLQDLSGKVTADDYPAGVVITADGKRLGEPIMGIVTPQELVRRLREIIKANPDCFKPTKEEAEIDANAARDPLPAARLAWELADFERVIELTKSAKQTELLLLRSRALDRLGKWDDAMKAVEDAWWSRPTKDDALSDDVQSEKGRILLAQEKWEDALDNFNGIMLKYPKGDRMGEAMYYAGLADYKLGDAEKAKTLWRRHAKDFPKDRLARRSAISLGLPEVEAFLNQELVDRRGW